MRRMLLTVLLFSMIFTLNGDDHSKKKGEAAGFGSRDATVLSIMGWGGGLAIGIATLAALLNSNNTFSHSH